MGCPGYRPGKHDWIIGLSIWSFIIIMLLWSLIENAL